MRAQLLFTVLERRETAQGVVDGKTQMVGGLKLGPQLVAKEHPLHEDIKRFYAWTPGGQIDFSTVNGAVLEAFPPGTHCSVIIQPWNEQASHPLGHFAMPDPDKLEVISGEFKMDTDLTWKYDGTRYRGRIYDIRDHIAYVAVLGYSTMFALVIPS